MYAAPNPTPPQNPDPQLRRMRFHVLHSPLGTLLAYHLRQTLPSKHAVSLIYKDGVQTPTTHSNVVRLEHSGVIMSVRNIDFEPLNPNYRPPYDKFTKATAADTQTPDHDSTPIESLIVTTSPASTTTILDLLTHRLSPQSTIVLMQPGLGVYEKLVTKLFPNPTRRPHFIIASPRHDAFLKEANHVVHDLSGSIDFSIVPDPRGRDFEAVLRSRDTPALHRGLQLTDIANKHNDTKFGEYASLRNTVAVLSRLDALNVSWLPMEEGEVVLRRDLVVRAVTDALAVALGLPNGALLSTPSSRKLADSLIVEINGAFRAQWETEIRSQLPPDQGSRRMKMPPLPTGLGRRALMGELVRHLLVAKGRKAPMLIDIETGVSTQRRYGLGYLHAIGRAYGFSMPTTFTLLQTIVARESLAKTKHTAHVKS